MYKNGKQGITPLVTENGSLPAGLSDSYCPLNPRALASKVDDAHVKCAEKQYAKESVFTEEMI